MDSFHHRTIKINHSVSRTVFIFVKADLGLLKQWCNVVCALPRKKMIKLLSEEHNASLSVMSPIYFHSFFFIYFLKSFLCFAKHLDFGDLLNIAVTNSADYDTKGKLFSWLKWNKVKSKLSLKLRE